MVTDLLLRTLNCAFADFLPLLIYVLVHCGLVSAEIEADYMWGLLHPSVLTGEGGYYLTTLSSAVLILKNFQEAHESKSASLEVSPMQFIPPRLCGDFHPVALLKPISNHPNVNPSHLFTN